MLKVRAASNGFTARTFARRPQIAGAQRRCGGPGDVECLSGGNERPWPHQLDAVPGTSSLVTSRMDGVASVRRRYLGSRCLSVLRVLSSSAFVAACSTPPSASVRVSDTDSTGMKTVYLPRHEAAASAWSTSIVFSTEGLDSLTLGAGGALHARLVDGGRLLIANGGEIVRLSADGRFDRQFARSGAGPGEFRMILHLGITSDGSVFASDFLSGRLSQLTASGEFIRAVSRLPAHGEIAVEPIAILATGRILAVPWQWKPNRGPLRGLSAGPFDRDPVALLSYTIDGAIDDTIGTWPGVERFHGLAIPFARSTHYSSRGEGTVIGVSDSLDLWLYEGVRPRLRLVRAAERRRPSAENYADWRRAVINSMPDVGTTLVEAAGDMPQVPTMPDIGGVVLDAGQEIWVGAYVAPGGLTRRWEVYSPTGELIGRLDLPAHNDPYMPSRTEILDVAGGRLVLLRDDAQTGLVIEVHMIHRSD